MYLNSPTVLEATSSFPIRGLALSIPFGRQVPYMFTVTGEQYPRSILRALRDALYGGAALSTKDLRSKEVRVIDPELLSEEPDLYKEFQNNALNAQLMYETDRLKFKKGDDALYVVDKGTNLPLVLYVM